MYGGRRPQQNRGYDESGNSMFMTISSSSVGAIIGKLSIFYYIYFFQFWQNLKFNQNSEILLISDLNVARLIAA